MKRLATTDVLWLLTLEWAGRTYRFASADVEIDGLPFLGLLTVDDYEERLDFLSPVVQAPTATVTVFLDETVSKRKAWLRSATAELSLYRRGDALSARSVRVRGRVRNPAYGLWTEPVSFEIVPDGSEDLGSWPPSTAQIDEGTYPSAVDQGSPYPFVYGKPSHAPALVLSDSGSDNVLIAGHAVTAPSVRIVKVDEFGVETDQTSFVVPGEDDRGRVVSLATASGLGAAQSVYVDWSSSDGGRIPGGGLGDCVVELLEQSAVKWDRAAWLSARDELNAYTVDFYLDTPGPPWDVARDALLSLAPVSIRSGPNGCYPVLWDVFAESGEVAVENERNAWRASGVEEDDTGLANSHRMNYRQGQGGTPLRHIIVDGSSVAVCEASAQNFGEVAADNIDSRALESDATALRALLWRAHAYAYPWRTVAYSSDDAQLASLLPGDVVSLTDADLGFDAVPAHVVGMAWDAGAIVLTLTIIHRP